MNPKPKIAAAGYFAVFAAIAIQLTIGIVYIWSVFQTGIAERLFDGDNARAGLTFSLSLAILTISSVFGGKLAHRFSTHKVIFAGGIIVGLGFFFSSFVTPANPWLLWVTYGAMGGIGMGFTYTTTIACGQKWFPHKKGFVTGIILSALGFGGVIFTPIIQRLINYFDSPEVIGELQTFRIIGLFFLFVCSIGSFFLKTPPEKESNQAAASAGAQKPGYTPSQMLKTGQFYLLVFSFLLAVVGGLMMIAFAMPIAIARDLSLTAATIAVIAISVFNSIGRLFWGTVSDKMGRKNTILILLTGTALFSLLVIIAQSYWIFVVIAFIGFFFGGLLSNYPALTADIFGIKHVATNYGFVLLGFGSGAIIASQVGGHFRNIVAETQDPTQMTPAFIIVAGCAVISIILIVVLKALRKKQEAA